MAWLKLTERGNRTSFTSKQNAFQLSQITMSKLEDGKHPRILKFDDDVKFEDLANEMEMNSTEQKMFVSLHDKKGRHNKKKILAAAKQKYRTLIQRNIPKRRRGVVLNKTNIASAKVPVQKVRFAAKASIQTFLEAQSPSKFKACLLKNIKKKDQKDKKWKLRKQKSSMNKAHRMIQSRLDGESPLTKAFFVNSLSLVQYKSWLERQILLDEEKEMLGNLTVESSHAEWRKAATTVYDRLTSAKKPN